jgi:hypothetical protein
MKRLSFFILITGFLIPMYQTFASEIDTNNNGEVSQKFGELTFFPKKNSFLSESSVSYNFENYEHSYSEEYFERYKISLFSVKQTIGYSLFRDQLFYISEKYSSQNFKQSIFSNYGTDEQTYSANGLENPQFGYLIRFLNENDNKIFNFDINFSFSPNFFQSKQPSLNYKGTVAMDKKIYELSALISKKINLFNILFTQKITYNSQQKITNELFQSTTTKDSYFDFKTSLQGQYLYSNKFYFDGGLGLQILPNIAYKENINDGGDEYILNWENESHMRYLTNIGAKYIVIPEKLLTYLDLNLIRTRNFEIHYENAWDHSEKFHIEYGAEFGIHFIL